MKPAAVVLAAASLLLGGCAATFLQGSSTKPKTKMPAKTIPSDASTLVVAAGCFWCIEAQLEDLKGVYEVEAGYAGGAKPGVTYDQVCSGTTGHAEVVKVYYNPKEISPDDLLRLFFVAHDPTTLNRQGPDSGTQYRSGIFYADDAQRSLAERIKKEISDKKIWRDPIVTTIEPLLNYTKAEEYHQDYFAKYERASDMERMGMNAGYCAAIVQPKVLKFRKQYADKLKKH